MGQVYLRHTTGVGGNLQCGEFIPPHDRNVKFDPVTLLGQMTGKD